MIAFTSSGCFPLTCKGPWGSLMFLWRNAPPPSFSLRGHSQSLDLSLLGREQSFLLLCSTSSEWGSSLSTLHHMAAWVSQMSFGLCGCPLLEDECLFHRMVEERGHRRTHSTMVLTSLLISYLFIHCGKNICFKILVASSSIWSILGLDSIDFLFFWKTFSSSSFQALRSPNQGYKLLAVKAKQNKTNSNNKLRTHQRINNRIQKHHNLTYLTAGHNLKFLNMLKTTKLAVVEGGEQKVWSLCRYFFFSWTALSVLSMVCSGVSKRCDQNLGISSLFFFFWELSTSSVARYSPASVLWFS